MKNVVASRFSLALSVFFGASVYACGSDDPGGTADVNATPQAPNGTGDGGGTPTPIVSPLPNTTDSGATCQPPDMLVLLDRTNTMSLTPAGDRPVPGAVDSAKLAIAIGALRDVLPKLDSSIRFGLELWPRDPGVDSQGTPRCRTLPEELSGGYPTNDACESANIDVSPALGQGGTIATMLDAHTTRLCFSTPTGNALAAGRAELARVRVPGRPQSMVLITDGADWDLTCPKPSPSDIVVQARAEGVTTYVVGFNGASNAAGVGKRFLNELACLGGTAQDFATACTNVNGRSAPVAPDGDPLFLVATNGAELTSALQKATGEVCCGCLK